MSSELKKEFDKIKAENLSDERLKQVVAELQNEVVQFESRVKKILERTSSENKSPKQMIPNTYNDSFINQLSNINNTNTFNEISDDDLWIPSELLDDKTKVEKIPTQNINKNVDFMGLIKSQKELDTLSNNQNIKENYPSNNYFGKNVLHNEVIDKKNNEKLVIKVKAVPKDFYLKTQVIKSLELSSANDDEYKKMLSQNMFKRPKTETNENNDKKILFKPKSTL